MKPSMRAWVARLVKSRNDSEDDHSKQSVYSAWCLLSIVSNTVQWSVPDEDNVNLNRISLSDSSALRGSVPALSGTGLRQHFRPRGYTVRCYANTRRQNVK